MNTQKLFEQTIWNEGPLHVKMKDGTVHYGELSKNVCQGNFFGLFLDGGEEEVAFINIKDVSTITQEGGYRGANDPPTHTKEEILKYKDDKLKEIFKQKK